MTGIVENVESVSYSPLPMGDRNRASYQVTVEYAHGWDGPRWAVRILGYVLNRHTQRWESEPIPSERTDAWLAAHRYTDRAEAVAAATRICPSVGWNGTTAEQLAKRRPQ